MDSLKFQKKKQLKHNGDLYIYKDDNVVNKLKVIRINHG